MSTTRLEYHEIREVLENCGIFNEKAVARLADLARVKSDAAKQEGWSEGYYDSRNEDQS